MDLHFYLFCLSFYLLYFVLPPFEDNGLPFWVPNVLCLHSEVVLWNLLSVQMFFWWICGGESGLPILFLCHLRTAPQFEHSLVLPFFGIGMKTDLFQSCGHCWVFQICWHVACCTFTASYTLSLLCTVCTLLFVPFPLALNYDHVFMTITCTFWIASVNIYSFIWMNYNYSLLAIFLFTKL